MSDLEDFVLPPLPPSDGALDRWRLLAIADE
jgi:hypothetical protein